MIETLKRGVRPPIELSALEVNDVKSPFEIKRLSFNNIDVEVLSVSINSDINDWQDTPIGKLRVDPLIQEQGRDDLITKVWLHFEEGSELSQKANKKHRFKSCNFREIDLNYRGHGWQELRRIKSRVWVNGKYEHVSKPKWLHVYVDNAWY